MSLLFSDRGTHERQLNSSFSLKDGSSNPGTQARPLVAVVGTPNAGKTTLFNALTGLNYKVANYPGVTVERREGTLTLPAIGDVTLVDLPGIYTLSGQSVDETIAIDFLTARSETKHPRITLLLVIVDASNLERGLYLVSQVAELGIPMILALNMIDIGERRGFVIRQEILARELGVPVLSLVASKGDGIAQLRKEIVAKLSTPASYAPTNLVFGADHPFLQAAERLGASTRGVSTEEPEVASGLNPTVIPTDRVIGFALLAGAQLPESNITARLLKNTKASLLASGIDPSSFEVAARYRFIETVLSKAVIYSSEKVRDRTEAIDSVLTHRVWGMLIFLGIMIGVFQSVFTWASYPMDLLEQVSGVLRNLLVSALPESQLRSLLVDGVVAGVGSVLIFVPQIAILYFFISILEDSGYLSRAAFLMDRVMRKCGLQGRSFIPLLSSFACAIPGIMSARVIPSVADRLATILVAPLMSCSARLPVYTLFIAAFIPERYLFGIFSVQGLVLFGLYLLGIVAAAVVALLLKSTLLKGQPSHFVMEMPPYHWPSFRLVWRNIFERVALFVRDAGTVILVCSIVLWFLASYPREDSGGPPPLVKSYAGQLGKLVEPVIAPLGFDWKIGVSIIASFAAREVFVSSMATVFNLEEADGENTASLVEALRDHSAEHGDGPGGVATTAASAGSYTIATALSLLVFYCFACQCMSTLAVCKRETGTWRWPTFMFVYMTGLAYVASLLTYNAAARFIQ